MISNGNYEQLNNMFFESSTSIGIDKINELNIIINDSDCSDSFITDVCENLENSGLAFSLTQNSEDINYDGSIIITLDQQYSSGNDTVIFGPHSNTRLGHSDALTISMKAALEKNDISVGNILCGQVGFIEDDNGKVSSTKPTSTEKALDENNDASFVTISFGTGNLETTQVSKSILEGLARYVYYVSNYDTGSDLIYRANSNDKLEEVAKYFNSDSKSLKSFNKFKDDRFIDSQTVINPSVENIDAFNKDFEITISMSSEKSY